MTWIMVDVETDGPCPGLFSMISLGAVLVEPRCGICGDRGVVDNEVDKAVDCDAPNHVFLVAPKCACQLPSFEGTKFKSFYGKFRPLDGAGFQPEALAVSGHSREETLQFPDPVVEMQRFAAWLEEIRVAEGDKKVQFVSDNNGFDWQFVNYYFWRFNGGNPFGHSSTNLGSLYKGLVGDMFQNFKHLRKTKHTHHPVDDATGNAEAFVLMRARHNLKVSWGVRR